MEENSSGNNSFIGENDDNSDDRSNLDENEVSKNEQNNIDTHENNNQVNSNNNQNQNDNNNNNNLAQQNNNGVQSFTFLMLARFGQNNKDVGKVGKIETNNSIAIWYVLKTTMDYLQGRSQIKDIPLKQELDRAACVNLSHISEYLKELGIVIKDIDKLVDAYGEITNKENPGFHNINENKIEEILDCHKSPKKSIEDLVFDELIKKEIDKDDKLIEDKDKEKILLVKNDFDVLKRDIQGNGDIQENDDDDIIDVNRPRNEKVFLSRAAKEFQNKVKDLKLVKEGNEQDKKRNDYSKAVQELDNAILKAVRERISGQYSTINKGYHSSQLNDILIALGLGNATQSKNKKKKNKLADNNELNEELKNIIDEVKGGYITGDNEENLLKLLSENVKQKLISFKADKDSQAYIQKFLPENHQKSVSEKLKGFIAKLNLLSEPDKAEALSHGGKIIEKKENKNGDKNVNDLKTIANNEELGKITLEYDEYNDLVAKKLFDNPDKIEDTMKGLLKDLLLQDPKSDECQKAKGNLKGMISQVNKQLDQVKRNEKYKQYKGKYLQAILRLDKKMGSHDVKVKQHEFFVPTFINQLFGINSGDELENLASNLETLGQDQDFKTFLSNIMQDDFAVDMIKNNFEQIKKSYKDASYKVTRRGKFKEEFWDNNLKGHLPFVGKWSGGRWKKNIAMLGSELLGGFVLGSALATTLGLSLAGGILPAIGAAAVILVTAIAIAVLVSLIMTLVKGFRDLKNSDGFYKPTQEEQKNVQTSQTAYLNRIYSAFLTFGADKKQLMELVADSKKHDFNKESSQGKFFKSMEDMKNFLREHAKGNLEKALKESSPFKILEGKEQPPLQQVGNQENNNGKGHLNNDESRNV